MKKIAIVTIVSANYGNRLQNYALQKVLESLNYSVETLKRDISNNSVTNVIKKFFQILLRTKGSKFDQFNKYIKFSKYSVLKDYYPVELNKIYDYFISGSDQVWNPYYEFVAGKCDFLEFANDKQKISYAASFGVSDIPIEKKQEYAAYLDKYKEISVREIQGAKIVNELTGRKAQVVLDPTLLLTNVEWMNIEKKPRFMPKKRYVFIYALGEKNRYFQNKIDDLAGKYEIFDAQLIKKNGKELAIGPSEFIYLLRNAEVVLTDSFHATVFSILFHKKFITFNRPGLNMNSRIESLAEMIKLDNYFTNNGNLVCEQLIDFSNVDKILNVQRKKSIDFLKSALSK